MVGSARVTMAVSAAGGAITVIIMILGWAPEQNGSPFLGRQRWGKDAAVRWSRAGAVGPQP